MSLAKNLLCMLNNTKKKNFCDYNINEKLVYMFYMYLNRGQNGSEVNNLKFTVYNKPRCIQTHGPRMS